MSEVSIIGIEINNKKSNHVFYSTENANSLAVIFPGGNNSTERPILQYIRNYFIHKNYDVLCISYNNLFEKDDSHNKKLDKALFAINSAIAKIENDKNYIDRTFISRSFGNVVSSMLKIKYSIDVKDNIYISPTSEALKYIEENPGFIITASNDEYLTEEEISNLSELGNERILLFKDGTHNLETDNKSATIEFHKSAVLKVIEYLDL